MKSSFFIIPYKLISSCYLFFILILFSNSSLVFSQQQNLYSLSKKNITERDFSQYNKMYMEYSNTQSMDSNLTLVSHLGIGPCYDAVVRGNYVFAGNGGLFQVLNVSDPLNPVLVGEVLTEVGNIRDIEIYGNYAFFVFPFTVVDISNLTNPTIINKQSLGFTELFLDDHYAYVSDYSRVYILDVKDPTSPLILSYVNTFGQFVLAIASKGNYLYVSDGYFIHVFDVSDKWNPFLEDSYVGGWGGLVVKDNYLYNGDYYTFEIYDISDPSQLIYKSGININGVCEELIIVDTLAYISLGNRPAGGDGLTIVNVADPINIFIVDYFDAINSPNGYVKCEIENNYAYISSVVGFDIFNIQTPGSLQYINSYLTSESIDKIKLFNNLLFCSTYNGGLKIIDFSDSVKLKVIGQYQEKAIIKDLDVSNNFSYLLTDHSLIILDIHNLSLPVKINEISFEDTITRGSVLLIDSLIVVSLPHNQLTIINIADSLNPFIVKSFFAGGSIHDLAVYDEYLFSAEGFEGLKIYKLDNTPFNVNAIDSITYALFIEDNILFSAGHLSIYDITNPESPLFLSKVNTPGSRSRVEISKAGNFIALAYNQNLEIINVSDLHNPKIAAYSRNDNYNSVALINNLVFAGNGIRGIKVFRNDFINSAINNNEAIAYQMQLYQNYPNPFNSTTCIKYSISQESYIDLKLYDILGNEIKTLDEGWKKAGYYNLELNIEKYSSGIYFYKLSNQVSHIFQKMILLK